MIPRCSDSDDWLNEDCCRKFELKWKSESFYSLLENFENRNERVRESWQKRERMLSTGKWKQKTLKAQRLKQELKQILLISHHCVYLIVFFFLAFMPIPSSQIHSMQHKISLLVSEKLDSTCKFGSDISSRS